MKKKLKEKKLQKKNSIQFQQIPKNEKKFKKENQTKKFQKIQKRKSNKKIQKKFFQKIPKKNSKQKK